MFGDRLEVIALSGGVRAELRQAAEQGIELVHMVAGASVTSSYDGWLEIPGGDEAPLAATEVVSLLRGSRVRLIGITPPADCMRAAANHSPRFYIDEPGLLLGVRAMTHVALDYLVRST